MKQLLQNVKNGNTTIEEVPMPTPREGMALVKIAASLVSAGTERMIVEFAEKNLVGKARSRPDLVKVEASLVSAGTERMVVEFAEKSLVGKARSRPDLVKQVIDKARREGIVPTLQAAFNRLDPPMTLGYSSA